MQEIKRVGFFFILLIIVLGVACAQDDAANTPQGTLVSEQGTETAAALEGTATPTATATATATATPTPTATPLIPAVTAIEQTLDEDGVVVISTVTLPDDGWVVVYGDEEGEPGSLLGFAEAPSGTSRDIPVTVDPYLATDPLHVRLHQDAGTVGEFEFPGADSPLEANTASATFPADIRVVLPAITVSDQGVARERGEVVVEQVVAPGAGWAVLQADEDGEAGAILGQTPVESGENENVVIAFDWRRATRPLHVLLYEDAGEPGRFEPDAADQPLVVGGAPVAATFNATVPEDVFVINQPAVDGEIYVERALVNAQGWLAVYSDFVGLPDRLLGYVPLAPGANEDLVVPIEDGDITSLLHIMVHEDAGTAGEFETPPGPDTALQRDGRMQLFSFQTDAGSYLQTVDQPLDGAQVTVPLVVADLDLWLVIRAEADGEPGPIIGRALLAPGVHRNVPVSIDGDAVTPTLYAALYEDAEPLGEFDPEETDPLLRFGRNDIQAPFTVETQ